MDKRRIKPNVGRRSATGAEIPGAERRSRHGLKNAMGLLGVLACVLLAGCSAPELEDRCFPMLAAVEENAQQDQVSVSYVYQKSQADTFAVASGEFYKAWKNYESDLNKVVDYNHLKVILIGQQFLEDPQQRDEMLEMLEKEERFPRNTYVCITDDVSGILALDETLSNDVGTYLEQMLEHNEYLDQEGLPTLGTMFQEAVNQKQTICYPFLTVQEKKPVLDGFYCIRRGENAGRVDMDSGYLAFLVDGKLNSYVLENAQGDFMELRAFQCQYDLSEEGKAILRITCEGEMRSGTNPGNAQVSEWVSDYFQVVAGDALAERLIDLGNCYKKLGAYNRQWYEDWKKTGAGLFEEKLVTEYQVEVLMTSQDVT